MVVDLCRWLMLAVADADGVNMPMMMKERRGVIGKMMVVC